MDVMRGHDAGTADPQGSLLGVDSRLAPLLEGEESSICARLAARGGVVICDQDIVDCYWSGKGRPSIPPCTAHMHFNGASASSTACRVVTGVSEDGFGSRPFRDQVLKLSGSTDTSVALANIPKRECAGGSARGLTPERQMTRLFDGTANPGHEVAVNAGHGYGVSVRRARRGNSRRQVQVFLRPRARALHGPSL